jgi:uncharacterized protein YjbI with pentapeptide repeats
MKRLRSFRQKAIKRLKIAGIVLACVILLSLVVVSILGYKFGWDWTGLVPHVSPSHPQNTDFQPGKTLWDWYQLLIIPVVLVVGGFLLNFATSRTERGIALDKQREDVLQAYIDSMSQLLLEKNIRELTPEHDEARKIARVRTLAVLPRLDGRRKRSVLQFLKECNLILAGNSIVDLSGADMRNANLHQLDLTVADLSGAYVQDADLGRASLAGADLSKANMIHANLSGANLLGIYLSRAMLFGAKLTGADLTRANLQGAILQTILMDDDGRKVELLDEPNLLEADLSKVDLTEANLRGAKVTDEQLAKAHSLKGATMPDGTIHP